MQSLVCFENRQTRYSTTTALVRRHILAGGSADQEKHLNYEHEASDFHNPSQNNTDAVIYYFCFLFDASRVTCTANHNSVVSRCARKHKSGKACGQSVLATQQLTQRTGVPRSVFAGSQNPSQQTPRIKPTIKQQLSNRNLGTGAGLKTLLMIDFPEESVRAESRPHCEEN